MTNFRINHFIIWQRCVPSPTLLDNPERPGSIDPSPELNPGKVNFLSRSNFSKKNPLASSKSGPTRRIDKQSDRVKMVNFIFNKVK